jgi:hypothetical protein
MALERGDSLDALYIESGFRAAALANASTAFCAFMSALPDGAPICPKCGAKARRISMREKDVVSLLGCGTIMRGYYECESCQHHFSPKDSTLGLEGTSFTPGVRLATSKLASAASFEWASEALTEVAGVNVSPKGVQRIAEDVGRLIEAAADAERTAALVPTPPRSTLGEIQKQTTKEIGVMYIEADGTGIPMAKKELESTRGKQPDGSAKTREAKIGCVFTQTGVDDEGNPLRDKGSTSYFGAIETADEFGGRVYSCAALRGAGDARRLVFIGDGAKWLWGIAEQHFPEAIHIVDLFHAKEHIHDLTKAICSDAETQTSLKDRWIKMLEQGAAKDLSKEIAAYDVSDEATQALTRRESGYFSDNADRMRYNEYKEAKLFVGSGVIEAACKNVIGKRLKQSGMFWSLRGANSIIALRCAELSCDKDIKKIIAPRHSETA